uniref:uncharacterized protein LOC120824109 n=1 Tax=Gasterosteus aculeatus aculeatus TaxID=481459 RepID=UPI001A9978B9|nr:uncharacterized protein LOC120824109 [Gasterosteus aculeatus aculeatus]
MDVDCCLTTSLCIFPVLALCVMKRWSKAEIGQLESKSLTDLSEESMTGTYPRPNTTIHHLDVLHEDGGADETRLPLDDNGWSPSDLTGLTTSSLEENRRSVSETDVQPEDGDQELEMSLRSHGGSLVERYHGTVSRIGKAWWRKHVFKAGDTVLRRCGRWRRHAGRSSLSSTIHRPDETQRQESRTRSKPHAVRGEPRAVCGDRDHPPAPREDGKRVSAAASSGEALPQVCVPEQMVVLQRAPLPLLCQMLRGRRSSSFLVLGRPSSSFLGRPSSSFLGRPSSSFLGRPSFSFLGRPSSSFLVLGPGGSRPVAPPLPPEETPQGAGPGRIPPVQARPPRAPSATAEEVLRRRLLQPPRGAGPRGAFHGLSLWRRSAGAHQEAWMSRSGSACSG